MLLLLTVLLGVAGAPPSTQSQTAESLFLDLPFGVATVSNGDVYISQRASGVILRVLPSGHSERAAKVQEPTHLAAAPDGALVFVDAAACRIRRLAPDGAITHLVGTGRCAMAAGGPGGGSPLASRRALEIDLATIGGLAFDSTGRLYFSDETNHAVRRLDADGFVRTFAGNGFAALGGDGEAATDAYLNTPRGLAFDTEGRLYIADAANCRLRRVTTDAKIETAAGNTCAQTNSASNVPGRLSALAYDSGQNAVFVASPGTGRILRFDAGSSRLTVALGNGNRRTPDVATPLTTSIDEPSGLAIATGSLLVADPTGYRVLRLHNETIGVFAGRWPQFGDYPPALATTLLRPRGLCVDPTGQVVVVDAGAERILRIAPSGQVTPVAGARTFRGFASGDGGPALAAQIGDPRRVLCAPDGSVYLAQAGRLRVIDPQGAITTLLSTLVLSNTASALNSPDGLALDAEGNLYFSEASAHRVVRFDRTTRRATLVAGTGTQGFAGDGAAAVNARLNNPGDIAFDSQGNLYISDRGNGRVRRITPAGIIETVAGSARGFSYFDLSGELATSVGLGPVTGLAVGPNDELYFAEENRITRLLPSGRLEVVAGYLGENDQAVRRYRLEALAGIDSLAFGGDGSLYFSRSTEGRIMRLPAAGESQLPPPVIREGGVISSSGFGGAPATAPGSWIEIYGESFASTAKSWAASDFVSGQAPTVLNGLTVTVSGQPARLSFAGPNQVNAHVPETAPPGVHPLVLTHAGGASAPYLLQVNPTQPGLLTVTLNGTRYAAAVLPDGATLATPSTPARAGDIVTLYGIGFGPPPLEFTATLGGRKVPVLYAGVAPSQLGLYQFNLRIPDMPADPAAPLLIRLGAQTLAETHYLAVTTP